MQLLTIHAFVVGYVNTGISYTTDTDGKIIIQWQKEDADLSYEKNVLYRLVETNAPKDYLLPENPEENAVYFYFSEDGNTANTLPKELPKQAFDLTKTSQIIYIENEKNETPVYELPESGGSGTTLFTVSGITLMGIAVLYGISSLGRRRERGGKVILYPCCGGEIHCAAKEDINHNEQKWRKNK